ncbi:MAG: ATPase, T2SS/T4P/T4SS family [bacterium]
MQAHEESLATFLRDAGMVSRSQLESLVRRVTVSGEAFHHVLSTSGALSEDEVRRALSKVLGVPFVSLTTESISPEALVHIPEPFARSHGVVAYQMHRERGVPGGILLEVALLDMDAHASLQQLDLPYTVRVRLTDRASLTRALLLYQKVLKDSFSSQAQEPLAVVDALLERGLYSKAEAIHLSPTENGFLAHYRIGGELYEALTLSFEVGQVVLQRVATLAHVIVGTQTPQEGSFKIAAGDEEVSVRASLLPTVAGDALTLHLLRAGVGAAGHTLESLGFHGAGLARLRHALHARSGLVLVSGGDHAGVTTLLYTLLDTLGGYTHTTITVEGGVSVRLPYALQTEAGGDGGVSMATGVRAALLQDPDVLMISQIADRETALLAVSAAQRGVLVVAGVAATSASVGIANLLSLGVSSTMLASSLAVSVGTNLVRALCPACKSGAEAYKLSRAEMASLEGEVDFSRILSALKETRSVTEDAPWKTVSFIHPNTCDACQDGYQGYCGVQEVFVSSRAIQQSVVAYAAYPDDAVFAYAIETAARADGAITLIEDGVYKAAQGRTSLEEVLSLEA